MFTGIIEEIGILSQIERSSTSCKLSIRAIGILDDCKEGDSIAINGVCLTVTRRYSEGFVADVMAETMKRTTLESLKVGDRVNLERSLRPIDRFGGHIVAGHVDDVGTITNLRQENIATVMSVDISAALLKYIAVKGSVSVNGASLTVTDVYDSGFRVWLIPFTRENTNLGEASVGDKVNIEVDMLARYVARLIGVESQPSDAQKEDISEAFLRTHGFL